MEKLNVILDKYFRGETTLDEEQKLKQYFASTEVAPEHEPFRPLFDVFSEERNEKYQQPISIPLSKPFNRKRFWIQAISFTGIAACFLVFFWIAYNAPTDDYAIVNGKRINNAEFAQQFAETKMNKVNNILENSLKPMQNIEKVRESLKPMHKVEETREKMNEIRNKLQLK